MGSRNLPRTEMDGGLSFVAYTLSQGEGGNDDEYRVGQMCDRIGQTILKIEK